MTKVCCDTNICIDTLENNFKQALHEQVIRIENKQKELRLEWRKDLKESNKKQLEEQTENFRQDTIKIAESRRDVYKRQVRPMGHLRYCFAYSIFTLIGTGTFWLLGLFIYLVQNLFGFLSYSNSIGVYPVAVSYTHLPY